MCDNFPMTKHPSKPPSHSNQAKAQRLRRLADTSCSLSVPPPPVVLGDPVVSACPAGGVGFFGTGDRALAALEMFKAGMGAERGDDFVAVHGETIGHPRPDRQFVARTRCHDRGIGTDRPHTQYGADSAA